MSYKYALLFGNPTATPTLQNRYVKIFDDVLEYEK
jgi:hypothetical protein